MIALLRRDLALALRAGGGAGMGPAFFAVFVTLAALGVGPDRAALGPVGPGLLWLGALLASLLSLEGLFATDREDGALELLLTAPLPPEGTALAKAAAHWIVTGLPLVLLSPLLGLTLFLPATATPWLVGSLLLGTPALSMIGTFGAALTVGLRRGSLLLALLVLPLFVPTLVFGAEAVRRAAEGLDPRTPMLLLAAVTLGALALLPFAAGAALRINNR